MHICIKCNQEREDDDFYIYPNGRIVNTCKFCQKAIQKTYDTARAKKRSEEYYKCLKKITKKKKYVLYAEESLKN